MSSKWRRFEVLLPLQFNDGRDVPAEWLTDAVLEVVEQFAREAALTQIPFSGSKPERLYADKLNSLASRSIDPL